MRDITTFINEANTWAVEIDNIIINGSGSMNDSGTKNVINMLNKTFDAKLWEYDTQNDKVIPLDSIADYKAGGPHSNKFDGIADFNKNHLGELTIFLFN